MHTVIRAASLGRDVTPHYQPFFPCCHGLRNIMCQGLRGATRTSLDVAIDARRENDTPLRRIDDGAMPSALRSRDVTVINGQITPTVPDRLGIRGLPQIPRMTLYRESHPRGIRGRTPTRRDSFRFGNLLIDREGGNLDERQFRTCVRGWGA